MPTTTPTTLTTPLVRRRLRAAVLGILTLDVVVLLVTGVILFFTYGRRVRPPGPRSSATRRCGPSTSPGP